MEGEELCSSLIRWLGTFYGIEAPHSNAKDLSDGVAMAEALTQIAPEWFDPDWMSKIKKDVGENYRLKMSNLKKVLNGVLDYYTEVVSQDLTNFNLPDVNEIAEHNNTDELGRLLQLVLGCAINCEEKEQYIQVIMGLEESVQHAVMSAIQELMAAKDTSRSSETDFARDYAVDHHHHAMEQLSSWLSEKEGLLQKIHDFEEQVGILKEELGLLKEEKSTLLLENDQLRSLRKSAHDVMDEDVSNKRLEHLQHQIEKLKEENFTLETAKEDFRIRFEQEAKKSTSLSDRIEQLSSLAEEARTLKDEMDVLRHTQDKVTRYETTIETYKKKLEELQHMKRQMKTLEDKNSQYMQQTISLEEDLKKTNALKMQLETYKKQEGMVVNEQGINLLYFDLTCQTLSRVHELHSRNLELEKKSDKYEFEAKRAKEKQTSLEAENERLKQERLTLRETNEELTLNQARHDSLAPQFGTPPSPLADDLSQLDDRIPPEVREKLIRLQHEVKILKLRTEGAENEKTEVLQSLLDDADERKNELETENRQLNQRILELEGQLEDTQSNKQVEMQKLSQEEIELKKKLQQHLDQLKESSHELQKQKSHIDDLQSQSSSNAEEITNLRGQLQKKDEEMRAMEERYKKYLEKAKTVIRTLDPKQNPNATPEVQMLRNQIQEKEKLIDHLERDHERMRATREREEKLIVSAWYEMTMQLHRKAAEERLVGSTGSSFLARQRQAASTRRSLTPTSQRKGSLPTRD